MKKDLPDVQSSEDKRNIALQHVGVNSVRLPLTVSFSTGLPQTVHAVCSSSVDLNAEEKGIHMSRLMQILVDWTKEATKMELNPILNTFCEELFSQNSSVSVSFPYFIEKLAPVTKKSAPMAYDITVEGIRQGDEASYLLTVEGIASNCCPCSKEISVGGAHNQRIEMSVTLHFDKDVIAKFDLEKFILELENAAASCPVFPILKRPDEKYVTETQYTNPKFVEDVTRDAVSYLRTLKSGVSAFDFHVQAMESIHAHNAYASHSESL